MKLRKATIEDIDEIVEFTKPYFYESFFKVTKYSETKSRERFLDYIQDCETIVVEHENKIVAMATLVYDYFFSEDLLCDYEFFYVSPEYRGTGVSRLLRDACENLSRQKGASIICACGSSGVQDGLWQNLFKKTGFVKLGTVMVKEL